MLKVAIGTGPTRMQMTPSVVNQSASNRTGVPHAILSVELRMIGSITCSTIAPHKLVRAARKINGNLVQSGAQSGDCCNSEARRPAQSILLLLHVSTDCRSGGVRFQLYGREEPDPSGIATTVSALCSCGCVHGVASFLHLANGTDQNAECPPASTDRVVRSCDGQHDGGVGRFHRDHHGTVQHF